MQNLPLQRSAEQLSQFLARRDFPALTTVALKEAQQLDKVDVLVLLGNAIPDTARIAAIAWQNGLADSILISGGIGHSTTLLYAAIAQHPRYRNLETAGRSEADLFYRILTEYEKIPAESILVENQSTNCGDNAVKALQTLCAAKRPCRTLLLMQDPTMQLRSYASFLKHAPAGMKILNYAPFIPAVTAQLEPLNHEITRIWTRQRFLELLAGEIPRLHDIPGGYGPSGKNFIAHIDIPAEILAAYAIFQQYCEQSHILR